MVEIESVTCFHGWLELQMEFTFWVLINAWFKFVIWKFQCIKCTKDLNPMDSAPLLCSSPIRQKLSSSWDNFSYLLAIDVLWAVHFLWEWHLVKSMFFQKKVYLGMITISKFLMQRYSLLGSFIMRLDVYWCCISLAV
jgi:hypothetical protein